MASLDVVSYREWGGNARRSTTRMSGREGLGVHWLGPGIGTKREKDYPAVLRGIERFHEQTRRWQDIAYNWAFDPYGNVYELRGEFIRSAANGTTWGNANFEAAVYLAGEGDQVTKAAKQALADLHAWRVSRGLGKAVWPHRRFKSTECPGGVLAGYVEDGLWRPSSQPKHRPTLQRGDNTGWVLSLTRLLNGAGQRTKVQRHFDAHVERAVRYYQARERLVVDGIVGSLTWDRLLQQGR